MNQLVAAKIESLRKRLLDPSRRNKLINLSITPKNLNYLRVIDELPDDLLVKLMSSQMTVVALPELEKNRPDETTQRFLEALILKRLSDEEYKKSLEELSDEDNKYDDKILAAENHLKDKVREDLGLAPIARDGTITLPEHAESHGIRPSYELPETSAKNDDGRHDDYEIQTLLLPERLDKVSKSIVERSNSFIRETGINVFQVAFGVLEWSPPGESTPFRSPICLLEAEITKEPGHKRKIKVSGKGDPTLNTSLAHKLYSEHRIELPQLDHVSVEKYFTTITEMAPAGWNWKVKRQVILGIFPTAKMAMFNDLNPEAEEISGNKLLEQLLTTTGDSENVYAENYDIDSQELSKIVPFTVMDADSSQYSALIDAAAGKNMSIEGPPGSGKSQTIVNIIADAIRNNKKILFVAEKLTALEVVKNRLDSVNLSHLVLSLQHSKQSKESIYENIRKRVELDSSRRLNDDDLRLRDRLNLLKQKKDKLNNYSELIRSQYNETGKTLFEVIGDSIATSGVLKQVPFQLQKTKIRFFNTLSDVEISELLKLCDELDRKFEELSGAPKLWTEATECILNRNDADTLCALAYDFIDEMSSVSERFNKTPQLSELDKLIDPGKLSHIGHMLSSIDHHAEATKAYLEYCSNNSGLMKINLIVQSLLETVLNTQERLSTKYFLDNRSSLETHLEAAVNTLNTLDPTSSLQSIKVKISELNSKNDELKPVLLAIKNSTASNRFWDGLEVDQVFDEGLKIQPLLEKYKFLREVDISDKSLTVIDQYMNEITEIKRILTKVQRTFPSVTTERARYEPQKIRQVSTLIQTANFFTKFSSSYKEAMSFCQSILGAAKKTPISHLTQALDELESAIDRSKTLEENFIYQNYLGELAQGLGSDLPKLNDFKDAHKTIISSIFFKNDKMSYLFDLNLDYFNIKLPALVRRLCVSDLEEIASDIGKKTANQEIKLNDFLKALEFCKSNETKELHTAQSLQNDLNLLQEEQREVEEFLAEEAAMKKIIFNENEQNTLSKIIDTVAEILSEVQSQDVSEELVRNLLYVDPLKYKTDLFFVDSKLTSIEEKANDFFNEIGYSVPYGVPIFSHLSKELDQIKDAIKQPEALLLASRAREVTKELEAYDLESLLVWYGENKHLPMGLKNVVGAIISKNRTDEIFEKHSEILNTSDGGTLNRLRKEFAEEDKQVMSLAKFATSEQNLRHSNPPIGISTGKRSEYTNLSLIRHELNKKRRIPIRKLTERAFEALVELHPCWMMSPLAVSQYLPKKELFDLVIIDEASQLTPENAIGALIRSKQSIIVGDTKQLPPTNFFQSSTGQEEEDDDIREDSESILDLANMAFTPIRQLKWHYRSKDASLIQFSNEWLYGNQLTIFPAAKDNDPRFGVKIIEVDGEYKGRVNVAEAQAVIQQVRKHAKNFPKSSLGIATMNSDQKSLIEQELELAQRDDKPLQDFINNWEEHNGGLERLFVKNLETVQGDERDVIFISTLYGPEKKGAKVAQRFGPINSKVGHRRLNVLFTRSKERMVTFTSLKPNDVLAPSTSNKGVQMFKAWLEYCKTGYISVPQTGGSTDSPFEDHVIKHIEDLGCTAVPQVGAGGFRIDIGIKHPKYPYGYLLAVECDGATYHSSYSARDRDRLRQEILEGLGWSFHRIWSTDWFNDQRGEVEKLKKAIEDELENKLSNTSQHADTLTAANLDETVTNTSKTTEDLFKQPTQHHKSVSQGSTVTIKFLQTDEVKQFRLLNQSAVISEELSDWIININTPLGQSTLDAEIEDIVTFSIGGINKQAEIIAIS